MRALTITERGGLEVVDRPDPVPVGQEVRVRVAGAGLNRADLLQRAGLYPAPPGSPVDVPGLEFAGVVDAVGDSVLDLAPGMRVFGIVGGGAQAELLLTRADECAPVPPGLDLVDAGGIPEAFVTAHDALRTRAGLERGDRVLVHAAGSGVGTAVVQLARAFDCEVIGTARTPEKLERARALGLDVPIVVAGELDAAALAREINEAAGPIDVVVDLVGGDYLVTDVMVAAPRGRIVIVGTLAGASATIPIHLLMSKRLMLVGTVLRSRASEEKAAATAAFSREVGPWLADGTVRPVVDSVLPLAEAESAYDLLASDATFGKVVLDARATLP